MCKVLGRGRVSGFRSGSRSRLAACETVIADDKITGKTRASAFWVRGDSLMKKRDYDNAIVAFSTAHDADPDKVGYLNSRGIACMSKGDDEHALADYDLCLQMRPNFGNAYNNRGIISCASSTFSAPLRNSTPRSNPA
jgi:Flp pilus assembly protein TadD